MELEFLKALVLVFGASAVSIFLLHRIRVPPIVGFIVAGVLLGPHTFGVITDMHEIEILAEIGVILLLFTVGIEFSLKKLLGMKRVLFLGGGGQVISTIAVSALIAYPFIKDLETSVFIGFLTALSSTAIVLRMLLERGESDTPQGRMMVGILIFQDLCVVPFMLLVPALGGEGLDPVGLLTTLLQTAAIIVAVLLLARWVVPKALHSIVHTGSRELFLIFIILLCLGVAMITSRLGLSLALGAFLAGLIISESEYAQQAMADILPFKDSFMGLFFVSVGMLMDVGYLLDNWQMVLAAVLALLLIKAITATSALLLASTPPRTAIHAAIGVAQIGEFSFILAEAGKRTALISGDIYQLFLSASVVTMSLTPFMIIAAPRISTWIASRKSIKRLRRMKEESLSPPQSLLGHVIIVGFGVSGRNLALTLKETGITYVVLEFNSLTVKDERERGEPIHFGDGTSIEILKKLGLGTARMLVVAISDPSATRKIVSMARSANPDVNILVRTRYIAELEDLIKLGATDVIPEEFESSIEIFSRVLSHYNVPRNVIGHHITSIRRNSYRVFRTHDLPKKTLGERPDLTSDLETDTVLVRENSHVIGRSLSEVGFRSRTGATVISVKRGDEIFQNPSADFLLQLNDIILFVGRRVDIDRASELVESKTAY